MQTSLPRDETSFVFGPDGLLLLAPLPGGRWLSFQDLEETVETVSAEEVVTRIETRLGGRWRPTEVTWFSPFRMHRRIVSRLTDGRRFLIGDAAHLSSPFGGEGLNSGLHDAYDLAWKLALVLQGHVRSSLLDGYALERRIADRHVLEVSDEVHRAVVDIADTVRQGRQVPLENVDPVAAALQRNARAMLDVDYAENGSGLPEPHPGQRYPDWTWFGGPSHHLMIFGPVAQAEGLAGLGRRWAKCVEISYNPDVRRERTGLSTDGVVLIRPDGHIGFRFPAADAAALAALDRHLSSYLIPDSPAAPF
jgi:6-methylpretetramide 4-monooxygenase / 4-hydroxy-6-methylpretetramide 12a-monooxygenase